MKKILLGSALTALLCNANAEVDQSLTGLHIGLGINVLFDEYSSDIDVADAVFWNESAITVAARTYSDADTRGAATLTENDAAAVKNIADAMRAGVKSAAAAVTFAQDFETNGHSVRTSTGALTLEQMAYATKRQDFKRRATNVGGELKLAYFHDFGNKFMIGVDLSGTIVSKTKKHVKNTSFAKQNEAMTWTMVAGVAGTAQVSGTADGAWTVSTGNFGSDYSSTIELTVQDGYDSLENASAANPGAQLYTVDDQSLIRNNYIMAGDQSEVSFEKDAFIPRLAFVLGGTYLGWFAGVRLGMAYMTGKVTATDANGSHSKSVSISSPFIGLHLMKQMNIKGINNGHVYVTADWHVGDGHRAVNINGIKSFKQNAFNLAAGLTWRCKLGR